MVIGEEDGSDSFSDDRGSDDSSGWRLRGWAASAARGRSGRGRAWGRWVWMRSGRVQSESRSRKVGRVSRGGEGGSQGRTQEEGSGACREGGFGTRRERGVRVGARREEGGVAFHLADGVLRERGNDGDRNSDGEGDRTGRGPAATASAAGDGIGGFCDTDSNDDRDGEDRDSDDGDSRGARFECGDVGRDSTERFEGAVGDEVRDRGQQQRQGRRQQLQRRGRQRQHQRRPGTATTARTGTATTATATAGAMASCVEGTSRATSERDRTADSNAGWPHRVVRRRFDVDETRTVFGRSEKRERGLAGPRCGETLLGRRSVWGRWSFRGRGWGGWAERDTPRLPSADCSGRRVGKSTSPFRRDWSYTTNK